jgi:hypothetical protein
VLEEETAEMLAEIDGDTPEPMRASLSGLVRFVAGALVEFVAFGSFSEYGSFDPATGQVSQRPVGWEMSGYLPGRSTPVAGHPELRGYWGGVRAAEGSWDDGSSLFDNHQPVV